MLILLLSLGKDTNTLQTSPHELMLELVNKYSHFTYPPKVHIGGTNAIGTSGKVVRRAYLLDVDPRVFTITSLRSF